MDKDRGYTTFHAEPWAENSSGAQPWPAGTCLPMLLVIIASHSLVSIRLASNNHHLPWVTLILFFYISQKALSLTNIKHHSTVISPPTINGYALMCHVYCALLELHEAMASPRERNCQVGDFRGRSEHLGGHPGRDGPFFSAVLKLILTIIINHHRPLLFIVIVVI